MRNTYKALIVFFFFFGIMSCTNSEGDPDPVAQQEAFDRLAGQWSLGNNGEGSIVVDGTNASRNYPGFTLSFTDGGYQTQNAGSLFNASGTWEWVDEDAKQLQIDTGETITLLDLTETRFRFSFNSTGAVRAGIAGNYTIIVIK